MIQSRSDSDELFNVVTVDREGFSSYICQDYPAKEAVEAAHRLVMLALAGDDNIERVLITDSGDCTNFLWERDKGIVYPPREVH